MKKQARDGQQTHRTGQANLRRSATILLYARPPMRGSFAFSALTVTLIASVASLASAQPSDTPSADTAKDEARAHFEKGLARFDEEAWDAALVEFLRSRELFPTRAATKDAGFCFRKLRRFDEALDMFEALLRDFPNLPADDKEIAEREIRALTSLVGRIELRGGEPGATLVVDNRTRGAIPLDSVRVPVGTHVVRVVKDGFVPFETQVTVASGQTSAVTVKLAPLMQGGRLRVVEQTGQVVNVLVDNVVVGKTPWEGTLSVGHHAVALAGEGNLGTQPARAPVRLDELTPLTLAVGELAAKLRIQPSPAEASVAVDGVVVGRGLWEGRLRPGMHRVELSSDGFLPLIQDVSVVEGDHQVVSVQLERDPRAALTFSEAEAARQQWRKRRGSTLSYEVRAQGLFFLSNRTADAGTVVAGSSPSTGPYGYDHVTEKDASGGGGAGGFGLRIAYMHMFLPDPSSGAAWSALRIGTGVDAYLGRWFAPSPTTRAPSGSPENHETTTVYGAGSAQIGSIVNVPLTLGYQIGLGSFKGTEWRGMVLGLAYTPSLVLMNPPALGTTGYINLAAFEVSVDFLQKPMQSTGTAPYFRAFAWVHPPVRESITIVNVGVGLVWY